MVKAKQENDEWPDKVEEYNPAGWLFKKLFFLPTGDVLDKEIFNKTGKKIREYSNFLEGINPTNY